VWRITWRDLVFRRRRFVIAAVSTALVLAITVLMSGLVVAVDTQNARAVERFDADTWWVAEGASGPFTAGPTLGQEAAALFAAAPGITRAEAVLLMRASLLEDDEIIDVNVMGIEPGGLGTPEVLDGGRAVAGPGEVVLDSLLGYAVGDVVTLGSRPFAVVGEADDVTYLFGVPTAILSLADAQAIIARGQPVANAIVTQGTTDVPPPGYTAFAEDAVIADLARVLESGMTSIELVRTILLLVAAGIVAFIIYLSSLERTRDVAVLKATGATNRFIGAGLAIQGVLVTLAAAALSAVLAVALEPLFPLQLEVTAGIYLELVAIALVVGLAASLIGVRRALTTDPAMAFG
jgi:putative ABC transport system permease protein